jgi:hypothetical protein
MPCKVIVEIKEGRERKSGQISPGCPPPSVCAPMKQGRQPIKGRDPWGMGAVHRRRRQHTPLPPPRNAPAVFITTHPTPLMDQVIERLLQAHILRPSQGIVNAFRLFLVAKPDGSARPILDLSPWTVYYKTPAMKLYSSAQVLDTLPKKAFLIKVDLKHGFSQIPVKEDHINFYGVYYRRHRYPWTRLPMGHALARSIMQRLAVAVARCLHAHHGVSMVAYLNDWLIFSANQFDANAVLNTISELGFLVNHEKSVTTPVQTLVYLGLHIDTLTRTIRPTQVCLQHMSDLLSIVPRASRQDLSRIRGYVAWVAFAMRWPLFVATLISQRSTYWLAVLQRCGILHQPRRLQQPLRSRLLYTDATPMVVAAYSPRPTLQSMVQHYTDRRPCLRWNGCSPQRPPMVHPEPLVQPTTITLATDSSVVYHTLSKGTGLTLRSSAILQKLHIYMMYELIKSGHALVVRWVPSEQNLADPLTREYAP